MGEGVLIILMISRVFRLLKFRASSKAGLGSLVREEAHAELGSTETSKAEQQPTASHSSVNKVSPFARLRSINAKAQENSVPSKNHRSYNYKQRDEISEQFLYQQSFDSSDLFSATLDETSRKKQFLKKNQQPQHKGNGTQRQLKKFMFNRQALKERQKQYEKRNNQRRAQMLQRQQSERQEQDETIEHQPTQYQRKKHSPSQRTSRSNKLHQAISLKQFKSKLTQILLQKEVESQPSESLLQLIGKMSKVFTNFNAWKNDDRAHIFQIAHLCINVDIIEQLSNEIAKIRKLTPEIQESLNKALVFIINAYSFKYEKKFTNKIRDINMTVEREGLAVFLNKIKYLIYHIESNQLTALAKLMVLYSTAHDIVLKTQNYFEVEKSGLVSCLFKITQTQEEVEAEVFAQVLFVTTRFSVNNFSGYLKNSVYKFIQKKMPEDWYVNPVQAKSIMYSFGKMGIVLDVFTNGMKKICEQYKSNPSDNSLACRIMLCVLNLNMMTPKQIEQKYPKLFKDGMKEFADARSNMLNIVRNEIWDTGYWTTLLSGIKSKHFLNAETRIGIPTVIHHISILSHSIEPEKREIIMSEVNRIQNLPVFRRIQNKLENIHCSLFEMEMSTSINSFQNEVWKIMKRLGYNIEHQRVIECLRVDLFFPRRNLIIELNGEDHYMKNLKDGLLMTTENNVTVFKRRILSLVGRNLEEIVLTNKSNPNLVSLQIINVLDRYPILDACKN